MNGQRVLFFFLFILLSDFSLNAQGIGVVFDTSPSWSAVLEKAKSEHKYIFVDLYATWCGPCRYMDEWIYPKVLVGDYVNSRFVSLKVQCDTGKSDDAFIQSWYKDAKLIVDKYRVYGLPTFLFFSPDGEIVHRASGIRNDTGFILLASHALDPQFQYYTRIRQYNNGQLPCRNMLVLATMADNNGDKDLSRKIARNYLVNCLDGQVSDSLLVKDNLKFLFSFGQYILTLKDKVTTYLMDKHISRVVDSLVNYKNFSWIMVNNMINNEFTKPFINSLDTLEVPNWTILIKKIGNRFGEEFAEHNVLEAKLDWYNRRQDWKKVAKYTVEKISRYGLDTAGLDWYFTNNLLYNVVFEHSENKDDLRKTAGWLKMMVQIWPDNENILDTYANVLYKLGNISNALYWEKRAYALSVIRMAKAKLGPDKEIESNLAKMKSGMPTWNKN